MKRSRMRTYHLRNKKMTKDNEGVPIISYGDPIELTGEVWPAGGKLQVETYGDRIDRIYNCKVEGDYEIQAENKVESYVFKDFDLREGDGVHLFAKTKGEPDYQIISIKPYRPLYMEVEKL